MGGGAMMDSPLAPSILLAELVLFLMFLRGTKI